MTGPGLISLFCFLMTAAHFLRGGMHAGVILCMGLAALSFSRRGWLRRSVTFLLLASLLFWGAETWHLARLRMMEGLPFLRLAAILAGVLLCLSGCLKQCADIEKLQDIQGASDLKALQGSAHILCAGKVKASPAVDAA